MRLTGVDLGQFNIVSSTSGLRLEASAQAGLAPSAEDVIDLKSLLTREALIDGSLQHLWTSRGSCFRLVISLRIGEDIWTESFTQLSENIAAALVHAKLWKQLQLDLTGLELSEDVALGLISFTLSLDHLNSSKDDVKGKTLHKLDQGVPAHHVRPPAGVLRAELQTVDLVMKIRELRTSSPNTTLTDGPAENHEEGVSTVGLSAASAHNYLKIKADADDAYFCQRSISTLHRNNESWLMLNEDEQPMTRNADDPFDSLDHDVDMCSQRTICREEESNSKKIFSRESRPLLEQRQLTTHGQVVELIDAALRASIVPSPKPIQRNITITFDTQFLHLSRLAPSLWCPQYVQSISSQALFIPTISHALASVSRRVDSLRKHCSESDRTQQASTKLWTLLADSAPQRNGAQQLSPLQFHSYGRDRTSQSGNQPSVTSRHGTSEVYHAQTSQDGDCDEDDLLFDDHVEMCGTEMREGRSEWPDHTLSALHKTDDEVLFERIDDETAVTMGEISGGGRLDRLTVRTATVAGSARGTVHEDSAGSHQGRFQDMMWSQYNNAIADENEWLDV